MSVSPLLVLVLVCCVLPLCFALPGDQLYTSNNGFAPTDLALDALGNVYASDSSGNKIWVLAGMNSTSPPPGTVLYSGTPAGLNSPLGLTVDRAGYVYVVSVQNTQIVVLAPLNSSTPLAEVGAYTGPNILGMFAVSADNNGTIYWADGGANWGTMAGVHSAQPGAVLTNHPSSVTGYAFITGITLDTAQNIYLLDQGAGAVYVLSSLYAANPGRTLFTFGNSYGVCAPTTIALDSAQNMVICDYCNLNVYVLAAINSASPGALLATFTANGTISPLDGIDFIGATVDPAGRIYIGDELNSRVTVVAGMRSVAPAPDTVVFTFTSGSGTVAFCQVYGITTDVAGHVLVTDVDQNRVVVMTGVNSINPPPLTQLYSFNNSASPFSLPTAVCTDSSSNIYVCDAHHDRVVVLSGLSNSAHAPGTQLFALAASTTGSSPRGCFIEPGTGNIWIAEEGTGNISVLAGITATTPGQLLHRFGDLQTPFVPGSLRNIFLDPAGFIYLTDTVLLRVVVLQPLSSSHPAGTELFSFTNPTNPFQLPTGAVTDSSGRIYVADSSYVGFVYVLAGITSTNPAPGTQLYAWTDTQFILAATRSVWLDAANNVYATDYNLGRAVVLQGLAPLVTVSARGDPQFVGFLGQSFQVHGLDGAVYSLISAASVQVNALFRFIDSGVCPAYGASVMASSSGKCWTHPGSYFASIGIRTVLGARLRIEAGAARSGFAAIVLDGANLTSRAAQAEESGALDEVRSADLTVRLLDRHHLTVSHGIFTLSFDSSDHFLNLAAVGISSWTALTRDVRPHGLLGQTWKRLTGGDRGREVADIQGSVDDYAEANDELWGSDFIYNHFKDGANEQQQ